MDYHLDHRVRLSEESQQKIHYAWSLEEIDNEQNKIGGNLIPWDWRLYFESEDLKSAFNLQSEQDFHKKERNVSDQKTDLAIIYENIHGTLRPKSIGHHVTSYSFLGTHRTIENFYLHIGKIGDDQKEECFLMGKVRHTFEWDFEKITEPDAVAVYIHLRQDKYNQILNLVNSKVANYIELRLVGVSGFYSLWSPGIRTSHIKILENVKGQKIEIPENCKIVPPALGHVKEFEFTLKHFQDSNTNNKDSDDTLGDLKNIGDHNLAPKIEGLQPLILSQVQHLEKRFANLLIPLWLIVAVLILLLIR